MDTIEQKAKAAGQAAYEKHMATGGRGDPAFGKTREQVAAAKANAAYHATLNMLEQIQQVEIDGAIDDAEEAGTITPTHGGQGFPTFTGGEIRRIDGKEVVLAHYHRAAGIGDPTEETWAERTDTGEAVPA